MEGKSSGRDTKLRSTAVLRMGNKDLNCLWVVEEQRGRTCESDDQKELALAITKL